MASAPTEERSPTPASGAAKKAAAPRQRPRARLQIIEAVPAALGDDALDILTREGRRTRVAYASVEAIAAVEIRGVDSGFVCIDLVLNWVHHEGKPLRIVRLRSDGFDPQSVVPAATHPEALSMFLTALMQKAQPVPLPDPESALGVRMNVFPDLAAYEAEVLAERKASAE